MTMLLRLGFLILIALGLASQAIRASRDAGGDDDAKSTLIGRLGRLHVQVTEMPGSDLLMVRSSLCDQPFLAGLMTIDGAEDADASWLARPDVMVSHAYLGTVADRPARLALMARWAWATVLFATGLRPDKPPHQMVMVAAPRNCTGLQAVDWSALSPWE